MSGAIIPLFPKKAYQATEDSDTTHDEVTAVDVTQYTQVSLEVRLHPEDDLVIPGSATIEVSTETVAPSAEDPGEVFVATETLQSVSYANADVSDAPVLKRLQVTSGFGGFLRIRTRVVNPSGSGATLKAYLSAQLVAKS